MTTTERKPHPHAEVIKKWADGHEVQVSTDEGCTWRDSTAPMFSYACLYRIKPEPKKPTTWYQVVFKDSLGDISLSESLYTSEEIKKAFLPDEVLKLIPIYTEENE